MSREKEFEGYILDGMARAIWVHAYMLFATQVEMYGVPTNESWEELAPDNASTRRASMGAAKALREVIGKVNDFGREPLATFFSKVAAKWDANQAYAFGEELAHLCMGTRDLQDSTWLIPGHRWQPVLPWLRVELEDGDELTWEVATDAERPGERVNPAPHLRGAKVQSLLFDVDRYTVAQAVGWAKAHGYHASRVDTTDRYHRIRQFDPNGLPCRTIAYGQAGIQAVICATQNPTSPHDDCSCHKNPGEVEILVVEDDPQLQKGYERLLRKIAPTAKIFVVDNYDAAVGYLKNHAIRLVVSDVDIVGGQNGVDVFRWVQANQPDLVARYVFVTGGHPEVADLHHHYMEKPYNVAEFREVVGGLLKERPVKRTTAPPPPAPRAMGPDAVAAAVLGVLPAIQTETARSGKPRGRYGPDKVFIAAIWRALRSDPRFHGMTIQAFKRHLIDANRAQALNLARADLVDAMDYQEVEESEIEDMGATFHFVLDPDGHYPWEQPRTRARPTTQHMGAQQVADAVLEVVPTIHTKSGSDGRPMGRFGDQKVFVAAIWRVLHRDPRFSGMSMETFKRHLVDANRRGLLSLARADLVAAMDPSEVELSEIRDDIATYHFVRDPGVRGGR